MAVFGIDISRYQKGIDLAQAMTEGVEFAILKIGGSDAGLYKDSCFEQHYANAKGLGLPVGAYYFGQDMSVDSVVEKLSGKRIAKKAESIVQSIDFFIQK